jgi:S-disulfanyl-L-cysteine oxidoreductase SoxD
MGTRPPFAIPAVLCTLTLTAVSIQFTTLSAQRTRTIWDGIYTDEQAARGRALFMTTCASCHKEDLSGDRGPALVGDAFFSRFEADNVRRMFTSVSERMPQDNRGVLKPSQYIDLIAFIFQTNKFPPGALELPPDPAALGAIRIVRKEGPTEAGNFSLVQVVGCLTQGANQAWIVSNAGRPLVTKDPNPSKEAELQEARNQWLGDDTYGLVLLTVQPASIAPLKGNKVEAKGLLIRGPQNRINLTSMQAVGDCAP